VGDGLGPDDQVSGDQLQHKLVGNIQPQGSCLGWHVYGTFQILKAKKEKIYGTHTQNLMFFKEN
jgi:hypothetical protein